MKEIIPALAGVPTIYWSDPDVSNKIKITELSEYFNASRTAEKAAGLFDWIEIALKEEKTKGVITPPDKFNFQLNWNRPYFISGFASQPPPPIHFLASGLIQNNAKYLLGNRET